MGKGIFGGLFDFNRDGKISMFERAAEFAFLNDMLQKDTADGYSNFIQKITIKEEVDLRYVYEYLRLML